MQLPSLTLPSLPSVNLSFIINSSVLTLILSLFFVLYLIVSIVLFYHWISYGMRSAGIVVAEVLFSMVSVTLFVVAGLAIHYY